MCLLLSNNKNKGKITEHISNITEYRYNCHLLMIQASQPKKKKKKKKKKSIEVIIHIETNTRIQKKYQVILRQSRVSQAVCIYLVYNSMTLP